MFVVVLALLAAVNIALWFGPAGIGVLVGPAVAVVLVGIARRVGLSWADLGLARHTWRKGAIYGGVAIGLVAVVYAVGLLLPFTRSAFLDVKYQLAAGPALLTALVVIPLGTVLLEEIAFRGVLLGMFKHRVGVRWATGVSSVLFGLWHVLPALGVGAGNPFVTGVLGVGVLAQLLIITGVVAFTSVAGVLFCELRRRSGSLLASAGLHWATNGLGVLVSALLWAAVAG